MAKRYLLDFEKPLVELEKQIEQIKELTMTNRCWLFHLSLDWVFPLIRRIFGAPCTRD